MKAEALSGRAPPVRVFCAAATRWGPRATPRSDPEPARPTRKAPPLSRGSEAVYRAGGGQRRGHRSWAGRHTPRLQRQLSLNESPVNISCTNRPGPVAPLGEGTGFAGTFLAKVRTPGHRVWGRPLLVLRDQCARAPRSSRDLAGKARAGSGAGHTVSCTCDIQRTLFQRGDRRPVFPAQQGAAPSLSHLLL